jgi:hypothetical protein
MTFDHRLSAVCDASVPVAREVAGRHEYDGQVQDLSPDGVARVLAALPGRDPDGDPHDEAHLEAAVDGLRVRLGELQLYRIDPLYHVANLDLACYERPYAPADERLAARRAHVKRWPDAVDAAIAALDRVPAPTAQATLPMVRGLAEYLGEGEEEAGAAVDRLTRHLARAAVEGDPSAALGAAALTRVLGAGEAVSVDLGDLARRADSERARLSGILTEACHRIDPGVPIEDVLRAVKADHPAPHELLDEVRALVDEVMEWTAVSGLVPWTDGRCVTAPMPAAQRRAAAGMSGAAPYEADGPGWFYVTLPEPGWTTAEQAQWVGSFFNRATLPVVAVHEVSPGHFTHAQALRRAPTDVRRTLISEVFLEGWAHYTEALALEEGFRGDDPRFAVGVALDGLRRVTRLTCAIGLHTGAMTVEDAAARFAGDAYVSGPAALAEAGRGIYDPTYGRYTWGRLTILDLRDRARAAWGAAFSLSRFHRALLDLGSPPLGLLDTILERG